MNAYTNNSGNDDNFDSKGIALATILICLVLLLGPLVIQLLIVLAFKLDDINNKNTIDARIVSGKIETENNKQT